jgi:hypothetical protein
MQKWRSFKQIDPLDNTFRKRPRVCARKREAPRLRYSAISKGAAFGDRCPHEGMAFLTRPEGPDLKTRAPQLAVLENGQSRCILRPVKKERVTIK